MTRSPEKASPQLEPELPFVGLDAIAPNSMKVNETVSFGAMKSLGSRFRAGDVLYGRLRPYLNKVWHADREGACSGELLVLQANGKLDPRFLAYRLHGREFVEYASHVVTGDRPRLDFKQLAAFQTALPPIETQHRIVARLIELFSELDDGHEELARARTDLEIYRKAMLKAAVTGELTAEWRATVDLTETGADVVQSIAKARLIAPAFVEGGGHLPESWATTSIGHLFRVFVGSTPSRREPAFWGGEVPWVSSGEVGFCRIRSTREAISQAALRGSVERVHPPGTVMLGMIGEGKTRGQTAILEIAAAHNQNCASIRVSETPIPPEFVYHALRERYEETRNASSGGNQPALNKARVEAIELSIPPLDECREIVRLLDDSEREADALITEIASIEIDANILRQSILAAAFRGELVQ